MSDSTTNIVSIYFKSRALYSWLSASARLDNRSISAQACVLIAEALNHRETEKRKGRE